METIHVPGSQLLEKSQAHRNRRIVDAIALKRTDPVVWNRIGSGLPIGRGDHVLVSMPSATHARAIHIHMANGISSHMWDPCV